MTATKGRTGFQNNFRTERYSILTVWSEARSIWFSPSYIDTDWEVMQLLSTYTRRNTRREHQTVGLMIQETMCQRNLLRYQLSDMNLRRKNVHSKERFGDIGKRLQGWHRITRLCKRLSCTTRLCNFSLELTILQTKKTSNERNTSAEND